MSTTTGAAGAATPAPASPPAAAPPAGQAPAAPPAAAPPAAPDLLNDPATLAAAAAPPAGAPPAGTPGAPAAPPADPVAAAIAAAMPQIMTGVADVVNRTVDARMTGFDKLLRNHGAAAPAPGAPPADPAAPPAAAAPPASAAPAPAGPDVGFLRGARLSASEYLAAGGFGYLDESERELGGSLVRVFVEEAVAAGAVNEDTVGRDAAAKVKDLIVRVRRGHETQLRAALARQGVLIPEPAAGGTTAGQPIPTAAGRNAAGADPLALFEQGGKLAQSLGFAPATPAPAGSN